MTKYVVQVGVLVAVAYLLSGCDKFDVLRAGSQTLLINRSTGELKLVAGTELTTLRVTSAATADVTLLKAKDWTPESVPDLPGVEFKLRTKYRDGAMLWMVEAGPFEGVLQKHYGYPNPSPGLTMPTVLLEMSDADGFRTGESVELKLREATRTVDQNGQVASLHWSGRQPMSDETYRAASLISTRWHGFTKAE